ncbi:carboxypeptidase-like regulatory domain-containing protein [Algoriphagus sp. A40]|uniref:carboxypeptidase-like regulatory domain-containing protein n=1 Tax=Algoriphagus sp. A40 TaxID=1945863 RepID=UPI000986226A|nr:carboxypeptidase-like regulatory domain-containing protein [Algoriphagus sp. A40]OOG69579.1 hypothetical protein B0E43_21570 [Algoriphagus sp. A40]
MSPQIQLPVPCSQDPKSFTPTGNGGFCQSCRKEVVDFRNMSQEEVWNFISKNPQNSCGIFRKDHLKSHEVPFRKVKFHGILALSLAGLIGISLPVIAQTPANTPTEKTQKESSNFPLLQPTFSQNKIIKGRIIGKEDSMEIPGASIILKGFKIGATANEHGEFELLVPDEITKNPITVVFSMIGYKSLETNYYQSQFPLNVEEVFLESDNSVMGEYIVLLAKKTLWQQFKGIFKKEEVIYCADTKHNHT